MDFLSYGIDYLCRIWLKMNIEKTKVMSINDQSNKIPIKIGSLNIEEIEDFTFLCSLISSDNVKTSKQD